MKILAVDDEKMALASLEDALVKALPDAEIYAFRSGEETLRFAKTQVCDIAFLDIELRDMNGLELAKALKEANGQMNIIFVTGFAEYALDAMQMYVSAYLLKPVNTEKILEAMQHLQNPVEVPEKDHRLKVQTFGNFDVFMNGQAVHFARLKSKELFAYLIDKHGGACTTRELASVLFEDKPYTISVKNQVQTLISVLMKTLNFEGEGRVIIRERNSIAVDVTQVDCDYYRFLQGDLTAINQYTGEYMTQYSWAEFRIAYMDSHVK